MEGNASPWPGACAQDRSEGEGTLGRLESLSCKVEWQVSQNLDWRRFCLAQRMSPRKKTSPRLDLILTPNDLSQTCKNYSYNQTVRIIIRTKQANEPSFLVNGFFSLPTS